MRADDLGAIPIAELLARHAKLDPAAVDDVVYGCANQAGEDNRNVARMSALLAGLPATVPAATVNASVAPTVLIHLVLIQSPVFAFVARAPGGVLRKCRLIKPVLPGGS